MATVVIGLLGHTEIDDADANTDWTTLDTADPDIKKEGTNAMSGVMRNDLETAYVDKVAAISCSGEHLRLWVNTINAPYMETTANGGYEIYVNDGTNTDYITIFSSDDYAGGWFNAVVDCALFTTVTPASVDTWGLRVNHTDSAKNATNVWVDFFRYSDGYYVTGGTNGDELDLVLIAARDADDGAGTLRGYGILLEKDGVFFGTGKLNFGNSTTTTYFKMDGEVLAFVDNPVAADFHEFSAAGTAADIEIKDSTILAAGTSDDVRFVFDMSAALVLDMAGTVLNRAAAITFASGQDVLGCTFNDCGQITPDGADLTGSVVKNYEGTVDTGAVYYNNSADPNGEFDEMTFEKGTAATHAIAFGTTAPLTMTLTGIDFSGFNASDAQNDSTLHFADRGSDVTWTVNLNDCTGNISYKKVRAGDTVNLIAGAVTVAVHAADGGANNIASALVYLKSKAKSSGTATTDTLNKLVDTGATFEVDGVVIGDTAYNQTDGTSALVTAVDSETALSFASDLFPDGNEDYRVGGPYPVQDPVTIVNSGTTATVTHAAHDMLNNDYVYIQGGSLDANKGVFQITYISATSYSYTMASTPGSSPTGTILSTFVALYGLTDASGDKSTSRVYGADQGVDGWIRKSSASPFWKEAPLSGVVDSADGLSITGVLTSDE